MTSVYNVYRCFDGEISLIKESGILKWPLKLAAPTSDYERAS
jgi:hypothetical protein